MKKSMTFLLLSLVISLTGGAFDLMAHPQQGSSLADRQDLVYHNLDQPDDTNNHLFFLKENSGTSSHNQKAEFHHSNATEEENDEIDTYEKLRSGATQFILLYDWTSFRNITRNDPDSYRRDLRKKQLNPARYLVLQVFRL